MKFFSFCWAAGSAGQGAPRCQPQAAPFSYGWRVPHCCIPALVSGCSLRARRALRQAGPRYSADACVGQGVGGFPCMGLPRWAPASPGQAVLVSLRGAAVPLAAACGPRTPQCGVQGLDTVVLWCVRMGVRFRLRGMRRGHQVLGGARCMRGDSVMLSVYDSV